MVLCSIKLYQDVLLSYYPLCISHKAKILGTTSNITEFSNNSNATTYHAHCIISKLLLNDMTM